jgi:hypothetical protein
MRAVGDNGAVFDTMQADATVILIVLSVFFILI